MRPCGARGPRRDRLEGLIATPITAAPTRGSKRHGVEAVAVSPSTEAVEGTTPGVTAILRFPDRAAFDAWYSDPDYQPLLARRRALTDLDRSSLVVLPAG